MSDTSDNGNSAQTVPGETDYGVLRRRRDKVAQRISQQEVPALLVSDLKNIRYLTGFSGSNAALLIRGNGQHVLATDGRYTTQIKQETGEPGDIELRIVGDVYQALHAAASEATGDSAHGAEARAAFAVEPSLPVGLAEKLGNPPILREVVESERLVKDSAEISALAAAGELADTVWQEFIADGGIAGGMTEIAAAADLEHRLRMAGADELSFPTILASGANGAKPHAGVSRDVIAPGLVTVDFGVYLNGYASDQTRTVCVGEPTERDFELYDTVYRAQKAGEAVLRPGTALRDVDAACRDVIEAAGYGEYFVHSTGHGVGLDVHEAPRAAHSVDPALTLAAGMTLTVEPGVYLPGETGLRIENTYVITHTGARSLNASPTELIVV